MQTANGSGRARLVARRWNCRLDSTRLVITAADKEVVANPVTIPPGGDTTLTLALKDGPFVLMRQ